MMRREISGQAAFPHLAGRPRHNMKQDDGAPAVFTMMIYSFALEA